MEVKREDPKEFIAIEYPGRVENVDKMMNTLGGAEELSKGFQERQRLQLKFRNNFYAKPVLSSEPNDATGMLLKIKVRRSKKNPQNKPQFSSELIGTVKTVYKFQNFADYQYLPIQKNEKTGKTENIYKDLVPQDITAGPAWFREKLDVPIFLPPVAFTRSDTMQPTILKNELRDADDNDESIKFAVTNRMSRANHGISISFNMTDPVPTKPNDGAKDLVKNKLVAHEEFDAINDLFKERPIWTLASIRAHMRCPPKRHLSCILASMAFYYTTGPWRNCFVRIGFDPRRNFESRFFQMLDYRVRAGAGFKAELKSRRQTGVNNKRVKVPVKYEDRVKQEIEEIFEMHQREAIFTKDTIPPFRARHYQFIDIHIPEIQEMLQKIPSALSGAICNEKRGWLPAGFLEQCRDILTDIAQENMRKLCIEKNISVEQFKQEADDTKSETLGADSDGEDPFPDADIDDIEMDVDEQEMDE